jgi:hypothetical protein
LLHARLGVGYGLVVDGRPDLFEDEVQQQAGGEVSDGFGEVFLEVAL